ncbi:MAG: hypothetical protein V7754_01270 [Halioglobus sp.]
MTKVIRIAIVCAAAIAAGTAAADDEQLLKQCRALKQEVARLDALREGGGSARKMDGWKRQIHDKQDEYSRLYCRQYRFELDKR